MKNDEYIKGFQDLFQGRDPNISWLWITSIKMNSHLTKADEMKYKSHQVPGGKKRLKS